MKYLVKFIAALFILFLSMSVNAKEKDKYANYNEYRKDVDSKIENIGYTELRVALAKIIHEMEEPWDITYYKQCIKREIRLNAKYKNRNNKENCSAKLSETLEYRYRRLEVIVDAIVLELDNAQDRFGRKWFWGKEDLALAALNMCYFESARWSVKVHKGWKRGDNGRSYGLCQIWSLNRDKYRRWDIVGYDDDKFGWSLERTRRNFYMSYSHLILHQYRCIAGETYPADNPKDKSQYPITMAGLARVYAGYGSGKHCSPYHLRPKRKNGKKVRNKNGKVVMINGYEPMRRAKIYWALRKKLFKII